MSTSDLNLPADVRAAAAGNTDAYYRLVYRNRNLVTGLAYAVVGDLAASEDIAQEVFVHVWMGLRKLRSPQSFLPWLRQVTRNRARQFVRERHRQEKIGAPEAPEVLAAAADARPDAEGALAAAQDEARLAEALDALPEPSREVVLLYYREGQSIAQVAQLLDLEEGTVKKRLSRGRERVRGGVLTEVGRDWAARAPNEAFCRAVMGALPVAGPGAGAGLGGALLKSGLTGKLALGLGGALGGGALGLFGILRGHRKEMLRAWDAYERTQLRRIRNLGLVATVVGTLGMGLGARLNRPRLIEAFGSAFLAVMLPVYGGWLMRLKHRRWAAERAADPTSGPRLRKEMLVNYGSLVLGVGTSLGTLLWLALRFGL